MAVLTKQLCAMRRMKAGDYPFVPEVSPGIQGDHAWTLLTNDQKGHVTAALDDFCRRRRCRRRDVQWRIDRLGAIHVRVRPRIEVPNATH